LPPPPPKAKKKKPIFTALHPKRAKNEFYFWVHLMRVQLQQNKTLNNTNNSVKRENRAGRISKHFLHTYSLQSYFGIFIRFLPLCIIIFTCPEKEKVHAEHVQRLNR
jgi:hypothetical protein